MKKMILTAMMLAAAALCRAQQPAETGERREWLTSFTAVEVSAPLDVKFVQVPDTEAPKIVYDTKGSYTTKFRAEVKDKVLRITERSDARRPDRTSVTVYYNSLERVAIADAVATFDSTLVATVLDLTVGGMAQVTARMDVKDLKMELTGKSTATLTPSAPQSRGRNRGGCRTGACSPRSAPRTPTADTSGSPCAGRRPRP